MTQQERISEIILQLKQIREDRNLSLEDVYNLVISAGEYTSMSSVRRVFAKGSENKKFRYQDTIKPIARGLLGVTEETPKNNDISANEIDALKNVILLKESMISELQKCKETYSTQIGDLVEELQAVRKDNDAYSAEIDDLMKELQSVREESQRKVEYLLEQITRLRKEVDDLWAENRRKSKIVDLYVELQASLKADNPNCLIALPEQK